MGVLLTHGGMAVMVIAATAIALPSSAQQAPASVSAADPDGMIRALEYAGYSAELGTDDFGDPKIDTRFSGWSGAFIFYGCDEETHTACDSVQLQVGFDRVEPMPPGLANELMTNERYFAIRLDAEGDPWAEWDIVTGNGEGIPTPVFMKAVNNFAMQVATVAETVFADERRGSEDLDDPDEETGETI